ncbi:PREDICTED: heavy metal-associated isoprenylated plant protein 13-like [Ipomoea nil]|uniref:heavy metal-associated isoprenylated plant protein 13-like n=1 Tax=Ipomoea nil TaxID=35883 RepID=UPI00090201B1|nr:PREDICTED: heavy metal-associated isoprenylated plant protein 13-like [Ipomoea nil]
MKKVVVQLEFEGGQIKKKAMGKVSKIKGVKSIAIGRDKKMTVIGDMDPVFVDKKLKTICSSKLVHLGPAEADDEVTTNNGGQGENGVQQAPAPAPAAVTTVIPPPQPHNPYFNYYQNLYYPPSAPPWPFY